MRAPSSVGERPSRSVTKSFERSTWYWLSAASDDPRGSVARSPFGSDDETVGAVALEHAADIADVVQQAGDDRDGCSPRARCARSACGRAGCRARPASRAACARGCGRAHRSCRCIRARSGRCRRAARRRRPAMPRTGAGSPRPRTCRAHPPPSRQSSAWLSKAPPARRGNPALPGLSRGKGSRRVTPGDPLRPTSARPRRNAGRACVLFFVRSRFDARPICPVILRRQGTT